MYNNDHCKQHNIQNDTSNDRVSATVKPSGYDVSASTTYVLVPGNTSSGTVVTASTNSMVASYTISAPSVSNTQKCDDDRLTATFTISSLNHPVSSTTSTSATINVPPSTPTTKKTDLDMLTTKASPTNVQSSFNYNKSNSESNQKLIVTDKTNLTSQSSIANEQLSLLTENKDNLIGLGITDDDKNNDKINTAGIKIVNSKRSLFDIDNATSQSLADKLRNEANKYSDAIGTRTTTTTVGANAGDSISESDVDKSSKIGSSPTSPTSYQLPPGAAALQTSERRPSWRLKLDSGSKVRSQSPLNTCSPFFLIKA